MKIYVVEMNGRELIRQRYWRMEL